MMCSLEGVWVGRYLDIQYGGWEKGVSMNEIKACLGLRKLNGIWFGTSLVWRKLKGVCYG